MEYGEIVSWIHERTKFGIRPGLTRINYLLEQLDNPQDKLKIVHIGGTNGKGSTTTFLRCLLEQQGLSVGTFTSPYIESFNERIAINGQPIPNEDLVELCEKIIPIVDKMDDVPGLAHTVEFEVLTAMMFDYFVDKKVDIVLVEVGLGGRYDCTNVMTPLVSVITTIGLDHVDILGDTIEQIASQKAGIIKENRPVIVGKLSDEAFDVISKEAKELHAPIERYGVDFTSRYLQPTDNWGESFDFKSEAIDLKQLTINMVGKHQVDNASVAIETFNKVSDMLHLPVSNRDYQKGLQHAFWPGRMEKISDEPFIVLDGAHNDHAMEVLVDNLQREFSDRTIHTIFGALTTKDIQGMINLLQSVNNLNLKVTTFDYPKACTKELYEKMGLTAYEHWQEALSDTLKEVSGDDLILITGSLYFISQVRQTLLGE
ncbi:bifunctional folylpolyglutamate synthase/dihydrofolate synthase [Vagococcus sp. JNUCC 83]